METLYLRGSDAAAVTALLPDWMQGEDGPLPCSHRHALDWDIPNDSGVFLANLRVETREDADALRDRLAPLLIGEPAYPKRVFMQEES